MHELLHRLWSKAVGTPGYDKEEWKRLEAQQFALLEACKAAASGAGRDWLRLQLMLCDAIAKAEGSKP